MTLRKDCETVMFRAIERVLPGEAVRRALTDFHPGKGKTVLVSVGKAAYTMAKAAAETLRGLTGIVITKYGHAGEAIPGVLLREAGHPVPDENTVSATAEALALTANLCKDDTVLFLLSGGGSALFEKPTIPLDELRTVTSELLARGAEITEINTVRKHLSSVKGGRFALHCAPAKVFCVVLSDIIGDPLDMIASGPAVADTSTCAQAKAIAEKYALTLSENAKKSLCVETPKALDGVTVKITGNVRELMRAAADVCRELGYETAVVEEPLTCEARDAGRMLARLALERKAEGKKIAIVAGGETVVHVTGNGKGGRNQEIALAASELLDGVPHVAVFSFGSDGTDGPNDAAGGYADGETAGKLRAQGISVSDVLRDNDAYHALANCGGLLMTGPTGTNVNDASIVLIDGGER